MAKKQYESQQQYRIKLEYPRMFRVIMHNDDFTTMDFVVMVLKTVFNKPETEAEKIMMSIHKGTCATVGIYTYDIAVTKSAKAMRMAREAGFPFKLTVEPVEDELPF